MRGFLPLSARLSGIACAVFCAVGLGARCAHMEPPSGGPADTAPPAVAAVYPAPGATGVPADASLIFQFDEWIDRNGARGQVLVSPPPPGRTRLEVDGEKLTVRLPAGRSLRPGATYVVTVLGSLKDLRGNPMGRAFSLRFSTGATLDTASIRGTLGMEGRRGNLLAALYRAGDRSGGAGIEALFPRDTGFRPAARPEPWRELPAYLAAADSTGRFRLEGAAAGDYALFAFEDVNGNFAFDLGLEAAAPGEPSLSLRPRAPDQILRPALLDTMPLRLAEAAFEADAPGDSAPALRSGLIRLKFTRPPHPARAAEAARYRVLPDSGDPLPVLGAGWNPEKQAWMLATTPLPLNARLRVEVRGRPDFPGRPGAGDVDTSAAFTAEVSGIPPAWSLSPLMTAATGPAGLPRAAPFPPPGTVQTFASSLPLTAARWSLLENRVAVYTGDSLPVPFRASRAGAAAFTMTLSRPLRAGSPLELRLLPAAGDSAPPATLYAGRAPDSTNSGGLRLGIAADPSGGRRTYWLQSAANTGAEHTLIRSGDNLEALDIPAGNYRLLAFLDRDGDGVRDPGALRPWIAQEPSEQVLDTLTVTPGTVTDVTERVKGMMNAE